MGPILEQLRLVEDEPVQFSRVIRAEAAPEHHVLGLFHGAHGVNLKTAQGMDRLHDSGCIGLRTGAGQPLCGDGQAACFGVGEFRLCGHGDHSACFRPAAQVGRNCKIAQR